MDRWEQRLIRIGGSSGYFLAKSPPFVLYSAITFLSVGMSSEFELQAGCESWWYLQNFRLVSVTTGIQ